MFGISGEHILILGIVLLIFGPRRLPELGNTMGKAIRNFKDAISGVEEAKFRKLEEEKAQQIPASQVNVAELNRNEAVRTSAPASSIPPTSTAETKTI
ncbi:MAG: twin-arginine translocase TatA/TatE family subunit [Bdellovibrionia bacterium]